MIYTLTLNPALDKTVQVPGFALNSVNRVAEMRRDAGGKGVNVSKVIHELGGTSKAVVLLAGNTGEWIEKSLAEMGITSVPFWAEGETRTNLKIVDGESHTNTDVNEPGPQVDAATMENIMSSIESMLANGDIMVIAGSLPAGVDVSLYGRMVERFSARGARVYVDADGQAMSEALARTPHLVKPNEIELGVLLGLELSEPAEVRDAARRLVDQGIGRVMVSMGGKGAVFVEGENAWYAHPVRVKVGSTVGAGDSVVAALAVAEERGYDVEHTLRLAMATGAANVMQSGTQAASLELVESLLDQVVVEKL